MELGVVGVHAGRTGHQAEVLRLLCLAELLPFLVRGLAAAAGAARAGQAPLPPLSPLAV